MFKAALLITAKKWEKHTCPSTVEQMNKMRHIQAMKHYSVVKSMKYWYVLQLQMNLENVERKQSQNKPIV